MAQLSNIQMEQAGFADRKAASHPEKYHPHCGEEHRHKPAKAIIGIALLIALSCLLYALTGHATAPAGDALPPTASQTR